MSLIIGPLIERIAIQDALAGRQPHPEDVRLAAEWNYRFWRESGNATEIKLPKEQRQARWPTPRWAEGELLFYALAVGVAGMLFLLFCLTWR